MLLIVDMGSSNLASVRRAVEIVGSEAIISADPDEINCADAVILPGVGAFADGVSKLQKQNLFVPLRAAAARGVPMLGICLGMQLFAEGSEEGGVHGGLGLIEGNCVRLVTGSLSARVPNIGWCDVKVQKESCLFNTNSSNESFYFAHSYHLETSAEIRVASFEFGGRDITAAIEYMNIYGVQFHPEKSQDSGLDVLSAFLRRIKV